ncbi:MAG: flagellar hook assembly protein FlgD [Desulfomonilia bacterium]|jgi:flagellar basal-body rod modification protein FlgD|uniref:Basal-body rod modification protein FlgD n=1 Tax=anaerobic digester metagenome TaxID=1263854 RepID=A0A485M0D2_9ZZZZ|nr:flagellar hook capping FlgD N-terminal domain-containing protein [Pseudomonadota bacterium]HPD20849.1 flagellar hook capping FlgD N-terminal domain-containing protein [Deltaproteobacteria bacterium]HRS55676.1 flagellar hook capping FlgD N-terminal domain-containing protein [Desulfomonilia bacterium]HRV35399.1 flagellar hook capping FlgD N-terminal domain-containing protein [Desulfomonilia bacterium]
MSTVGMDAILSNQGPAKGGSTSEAVKSLGKNDFLKLLVKQLQYQDPLNPVENTDFTAQLAQFTTLETLSNIDENITQLGILQNSINNMNAMSFIGKQVNAKGNILNYTGSDLNIDFSLDALAAEVRVKIFAEDGTLVRTIERENVQEGNVQFVWDGTDHNGERVSEGRYRFFVQAADYEGNAVGTTSYAAGVVTGIRYDKGITYLIIGNKEVNIADIDKIQG